MATTCWPARLYASDPLDRVWMGHRICTAGHEGSSWARISPSVALSAKTSLQPSPTLCGWGVAVLSNHTPLPRSPPMGSRPGGNILLTPTSTFTSADVLSSIAQLLRRKQATGEASLLSKQTVQLQVRPCGHAITRCASDAGSGKLPKLGIRTLPTPALCGASYRTAPPDRTASIPYTPCQRSVGHGQPGHKRQTGQGLGAEVAA